MKRNIHTLAVSAMLLAMTSPAFASGPSGTDPVPPPQTSTSSTSDVISYLASLLGL